MTDCKSVKVPITKGEDKIIQPTDNLIDETKYKKLVNFYIWQIVQDLIWLSP